MDKRKRIVIGISGASCSGKSWLARQIYNISPSNIVIFELDKYYKDIEYVKNLEFQHDNPDAIDYDRAFNDFKKLMNGEDISIPVYDYESHKICGWNTCSPTPVLIIEGLFAFADEKFRNMMDCKIWIEAMDSIKYERRINRDIKERGDNIVNAKRRYEHDVMPAYNKFVLKYKEYANLVYVNNYLNGPNKSSCNLINILINLFHKK